MPINVVCSCGVRLTVRDEAAGRNVSCPKCQSPVPVPAPAPQAPPPPPGVADSTPEVPRVPCPYCAELILPAARLCPFCKIALKAKSCTNCGSVNPATMIACLSCGAALGQAPMARPPMGRAPSARPEYIAPPPDDNLSCLDWFLGVILPCVGFIVGIVYLCTGKSARGGKLIALSIIVGVIALILRMAIAASQYGRF